MVAAIRRRFGLNGASICVFGSSAGELFLHDGSRLQVRPLASMTGEDVADSHVIHLAYLTREKADVLGHAAFATTNREIDARVMAAIRDAAPTSLFVASSGAAAMAEADEDSHPYGTGKLEQEDRFLTRARAHQVPALIGRIFNIAGPFINKLDAYAIGSFCLQALEHGEIKVAASTPTYRSYLHVDDLCTLVIEAALAGVGRDRPIDLCGAEVLEMEDLARVVARVAGGEVGVVRPVLNCDSTSAYLGRYPDTGTLALQLGVSLADVRQQAVDTFRWVDAIRESALGRVENA
jgi:nucleoside-diphosphate-sugar epimerase